MAKMTTKEFQAALIILGYDLGPSGADGDAGPKTLKATAAFQKSVGLAGGGIPGPKTFDRIKQALVSRATEEPVKVPVSELKPLLWMDFAKKMVGTVEGKGDLNNPEVVKMFAESGFPGIKKDSVAWCAAFVGAMLKRADVKPSGSLAARSYESWGVGLNKPAFGCVATKKRANSTWQGHVFFVVGENKTHVFGLGGNQRDSVNITPFKKSEVTSYRWPEGVDLPEPHKLPTTVAGAAKFGGSEA